jgi:4'-phosphopantetheinyl transferase
MANSPHLEQCQLGDRQIHVWRAELNLPKAAIAELKSLLSFDEIARADRLKIPQRCDRFIAGRGILRQILGQYLNQPPGKLQFKYGDRGKPYVASNFEHLSIEHLSIKEKAPVRSTQSANHLIHLGQAIYFNLAHSHDLALYAFTRVHGIGIDLEKIRPMPNADRLAQRFFTTTEHKVMQSLTAADQQEAFFKAWTRKEAYLKAVGVGIGQLKQVELNILPQLPAQVLSIAGDRQAAQRWHLADLAIDPGFAAALAIEATELEVQYFNFHRSRVT